MAHRSESRPVIVMRRASAWVEFWASQVEHAHVPGQSLEPTTGYRPFQAGGLFGQDKILPRMGHRYTRIFIAISAAMPRAAGKVSQGSAIPMNIRVHLWRKNSFLPPARRNPNSSDCPGTCAKSNTAEERRFWLDVRGHMTNFLVINKAVTLAEAKAHLSALITGPRLAPRSRSPPRQAGRGYRTLPLSWEDCERATGLPDFHKDPMDRMLIAAALTNNLVIVTNDRMIAGYGVPTVW